MQSYATSATVAQGAYHQLPLETGSQSGLGRLLLGLEGVRQRGKAARRGMGARRGRREKIMEYDHAADDVIVVAEEGPGLSNFDAITELAG
jgi:hypothetical protein